MTWLPFSQVVLPGGQAEVKGREEEMAVGTAHLPMEPAAGCATSKTVQTPI